MTILISGGDSFTYGNELQDCYKEKNYSEFTWAALLAKQLKMNYCCTAKGGDSNSAIRRKVMNTINKYDGNNLCVVVMWSFPNRYEFKFTYDTQQSDGKWYSINPWTHQEVDPSEHYIEQNNLVLTEHKQNRKRAENLGITDFAKTFINHVAGEEYWEIYQSLVEIIMLQNYLKTKDIPFLFTCVSSTLLSNYTITHPDSTILTLKRDIDFDQWFFPGDNYLGMYEWSNNEKFPFYTTHPKEIAHEKFVEKLLTSNTKFATMYR
jgi:hypothetical protein